MNVEILHEARLDIADGIAFYDRQGEEAGDYFFERIFADIKNLEDTAGVHEIHLGYHRKLASRHPYLIYYQINSESVEVVAVLDGRGRPADIENVLRRR
jgi:plasmid stabilization system protein ParE